MRQATLRFAVPVDVAFAYLADPRHRPEWQSSLRRVELLEPRPPGAPAEPHVGLRWRDHTVIAMAPEMTITALEPGVLWAETGRWRGIEADLTLRFAPHRRGCSVDAELEVRGRGVLRPVGRLGTAAGLLAVRSDLRRAGRLLEERHGAAKRAADRAAGTDGAA